MENKCQCNIPTCGKCLGLSCIDDNCVIHTIEAKKRWVTNWEKRFGRPFQFPDRKWAVSEGASYFFLTLPGSLNEDLYSYWRSRLRHIKLLRKSKTPGT